MGKYYRSFIAAAFLSLVLPFNTIKMTAGNSGNKKKYVAAKEQKDELSQILSPKGLIFTPNMGQITDTKGNSCPDVLYKSSSSGADVYLRKTGISYVYTNMREVTHEVHEMAEELIKAGIISETDEHKTQDSLIQKESIKVHRVDMEFAGCNRNVKAINESVCDGYQNFFYAHCPRGVLNVKRYNKVTYKNIYDGIDIEYYGSSGKGLKYDIVLQPHADPNQIKLQWKGTESIRLNREENGSTGLSSSLVIKTSVNEFTESLPKVYQNINGKIVDIEAMYSLSSIILSEVEGGEGRQPARSQGFVSAEAGGQYLVTFELGTYNPEYPLIIDPWTTYYGGSDEDIGIDVATDNSGNPVFVGYTNGTTFPVSAGVSQTIFGGGAYDTFIVKMDAISGGLIFATFYGGSGIEYVSAVSIDNNNNVLITGGTTSADLPTFDPGAGAYFTSVLTTGMNAFIAKINPSGTTLLWSTYYNYYHARGITTDVADNIIVSGEAFPGFSTLASFQGVLGGSSDAGIIKFNSSCARQWSTFYGGNTTDLSTAVAVDTMGNIFFTGTSNGGFPVFSAHQPTFGGGGGEAFLVKFNSNGSRIWSTYYGGGGGEAAKDVATDGLGNVIIVGYTNSLNNIVSPGAFQTPYGGGFASDGFIAKFNNLGVRQWGTYLGGNRNDYLYGVDVDVNNNIYAYGEFEDIDGGNYPISTCAYQPTNGGGEDVFIAKYSPSGIQTCITYVGGTLEDDLEFFIASTSRGIAINNNTIYITGATKGGFPITGNAFQAKYGGGPWDAFFAKLCTNICEPKTLGLNYSTTSACINAMPATFTPTFNLTCDTTGYKFLWTFTGGTPATSTSAKPSVTYTTPGFYPVKLVLSTLCKKDSVLETMVINPCTINASVNNTSVCSGNCTTITAAGSGGTTPYTYSWNTGATTSTINVCPTTTIDYSVMVTDANGNFARTVSRIIIQSVTAAVSTTNISCTTGGATVTAITGAPPYIYSWSNGFTIGPTLYSSITNLAPGSYNVTVTDNNGCTISQPFTISVTGSVSAAFTNPPACVGSAVTFTNTGTTGTYSWSIPSPVNISGTTVNFTYTFLTAGTYSVTHTVTTSGCTNTVTQNIIVTNCSTGPTVTATGSSVCPGSCATLTSSGSGSTSPYTYSWSNAATTQNINPCPVSTSTYTVTIRDAGGNTATSIAVATVNPAITVGLTVNNTTCSGGTNGSGVANPGGGTSPYTYSWNNGQTTQSATSLSQGTYTVKVTDSKGCTSTSTTTLISPPSLTGQFTKGTANCAACGCKEWIMVNATGGTSPYSYSWPNSGGYTNRYKNQLCPGTYTINIKDKNGCSANVNITAP